MEEDGEWEGLGEYANMWSTPASTLQPNSRRSSELGNTSGREQESEQALSSDWYEFNRSLG